MPNENEAANNTFSTTSSSPSPNSPATPEKVKKLIDWQQTEEMLVEKSTEIIARFASEHPDEQFYIFAYWVGEEAPGQFGFYFETWSNYLKTLYERQLATDKSRQKYLIDSAISDRLWPMANSLIEQGSLFGTQHGVGWFAYQFYDCIEFPEWEDYDFEAFPKVPHFEDGYSWYWAKLKITIWKVIKQLIAARVFDQLNKTAPFLLGYEVNENGMQIIAGINWPDAATQ